MTYPDDNNVCCSMVEFQTLPVSSGVPQGSILGPHLFLLDINYLPTSTSSPSVDVSLFADDTKCFTVVSSLTDAMFSNPKLKNRSRNGPKLGDSFSS